MTIGHELLGTGPEKVVILHDWQGDHRNYDLARPFFDAARYTYAFMDLRGYGWSRTIAGRHTAEEASADVLALVDHLGWPRFHVVGHSMTGMVVQRVALDGADRVKSVVAANPVPACGLQMPAENLGFFESTITNDENFRRLLREICNRELSPAWVEYKLARCRSSADPATRADYLRMFNATDFSARVQGTTTPILVLLGEYDHESLSEASMRRTFGAWYPNVEFKMCLNAGHYPMQEMPPYYVAAIESFMARHA
jgi:pimeloyl-ACP methyl ester carboxylesterase